MACTQNSPTVALSITTGVLQADVIVDPALGIPPNPLVANPGGLYVSGADGWLALPATLTFVSATSPTYVAATSSDLTSFLSPGSKLKLTQAAVVRYFVIVAITNTQVTLFGGDAQVLANSAITAPAFGLRGDPSGFPDMPCSALPTVAYDGMRVSFIADASNGVEWALKYKSAEPTYKWRFLGGPPLYAEVATNESTASATYAALATPGPSVVVPRSGDYVVDHGYWAQGTGSITGESYMSYDIGGTGAVDADAVIAGVSAGGTLAEASGMRRRVKSGLVAAATLTGKYRVPGAATMNFGNRWLSIIPRRVI